jgi:DNA-binding transcriptional regulator LsrR (DeoR family)
MTHDQIGGHLGLSRLQVSRLLSHARLPPPASTRIKIKETERALVQGPGTALAQNGVRYCG